MTLIALSKVDDQDVGLASSLVNTGRMAGGSIGLAILGTVAWSVVANTARSSANARRTCREHPPPDAPMRLSEFTSTEVVYGVTGTEVTELPEYGVSP